MVVIIRRVRCVVYIQSEQRGIQIEKIPATAYKASR